MFAGHPFDTAKTRLQVMPRFSGMSTWGVLSETARLEGPRALYRGLSLPLVSAAGLNACIFTVEGLANRAVGRFLGEDYPQLATLAAGTIAGTVQSPVVCIADIAKTQRQAQFTGGGGSATLIGPVAVLRQRIASLGLMQGIFQGLGPTAVKEGPSYGVYFLAYLEASKALEAAGAGSIVGTLFAGGIAGCVSLGMVHPVDVVKARIQALPIDAPASERSALRVMSTGFAKEGGSFFLRGFTASMLRAFVINAFTFGGVELAKHWIMQF